MKRDYKELGYNGYFRSLIMQSEVGKIVEYLNLLEKETLIIQRRKGILKMILLFFVKRKRNSLGVMLGFHIPVGVFDTGLLIYHSGSIVVNNNARVGKNCVLHGENCIGNNGTTEDAPIIGDNADIGIGAKIIGGIRLGNNIHIGANAVVTKSFEEDNITLIGIPAKKLEKSYAK